MLLRPSFFLAGITALYLLVSCQGSGGREEKTADEQAASELYAIGERIRADSLDADAYYDRALYYLGQKHVNDALSDISKAIQLDEGSAAYFVVLSDIYLALNNIPSCLEALQKAEDLDPGNNDALLKQAELYLVLQDYPNVFNYTGKAISQEKHNPVAYFIRGYALMEIGDTAEAIRNYQAAIDLDQSYFNALMQLGIIYSVKNDPLAKDYFSRATEVDPNRPEAYYLLGLSYQTEEDFTRAAEAYEKLLAIAPDYKEGYYNLGYINLVYLNDYAAAAGYFSEAIALDPGYVDAYFNRGYCYELSGESELSGQDYRQALKLQPNYDRAVQGLNRLDRKMLGQD